MPVQPLAGFTAGWLKSLNARAKQALTLMCLTAAQPGASFFTTQFKKKLAGKGSVFFLVAGEFSTRAQAFQRDDCPFGLAVSFRYKGGES